MPVTLETVEDKLMKEISADLDLPYSMVRDVVINGQAGFTKHVMESGQYNGVRWPFFGAFKVKSRHVQVKKYMRGLNKMQRQIMTYRIREGHVFPRRFERER